MNCFSGQVARWFVVAIVFSGSYKLASAQPPATVCTAVCKPMGTIIGTTISTTVWAAAAAKAPTDQTGEMKHAGRLRYTPMSVFGGSCVWIGGKWVLTARHGVKKWSASLLKVDFPAHGKKSYAVHAIHYPPDAGVDLALLELEAKLPFKDPLTLDSRQLVAKSTIRFGGYGHYGVAGEKIAGTNRFHWGTNVLTKADAKTARFVLDKASKKQPQEAIPALFDSGSPVFVSDGKQQLLVGVVIKVSNGASPTVGDRAVITCLAGETKWIKKMTGELKWHPVKR